MLRDDISASIDNKKQKINELIVNSSDFAYALNYFLKSFSFVRPDGEIIKINARFRAFICAISHRIRNEQSSLIDDVLKNDLECSRETVGRIRKRLFELQQQCSQSLIQIVEGERYKDDKGKFKYKPTQYKISFLEIIADAVFSAQSAKDYKYNFLRRIEKEIDKRIAETPLENGWKKRKPKRKRPDDAVLSTLEKVIKNSGYKYLVRSQKIGYDTFEANNFLIGLHEMNFEELISQSDSDYYGKTMQEIGATRNNCKWSDEKQRYVKVE